MAGNITVGSHEHVGQLFLDNPSGYMFGGTGDITMDVLNHTGGTGAFATVTVNSGNHTINVPLNLSSDTHFTVAAGSSLTVAGALNATGRSISKDGTGSVQFTNVRAAGLNVSAGIVQIAANGTPNSPAGTSVVSSLSILSSGTLDLTNNAMVIPYTTVGTLVGDTRQAIFNGRLATSLFASGHALGYADNAVLGRSSFAGQDVSSNKQVLIAYTFSGDANLDGVVNLLDLNALATNFGLSTATGSGRRAISPTTARSISRILTISSQFRAIAGCFTLPTAGGLGSRACGCISRNVGHDLAGGSAWCNNKTGKEIRYARTGPILWETSFWGCVRPP